MVTEHGFCYNLAAEQELRTNDGKGMGEIREVGIA